VESEHQFGRRPLKRKVMMPKKADETAQPEVEEKLSGTGVTGATTESAKPVPETRPDSQDSRPVDRPKQAFKPEGRPRRNQRDKGERSDRGDRSDRPKRQDLPRRSPKPPVSDHREQKKFGVIKLSVVIPAYNEEQNVAPLLSQFGQLFSKLPYKAELIFIDDGSLDRTLVKVRELQSNYPWLKVYSHQINRGLTIALETGFAKATGKMICFYPADLQYHADEIPKLVSKLDSGADVVTGWKHGNYGLKAFGSFIYNRLSRSLFNVKVHDLNSIKAFKREVSECFTFRRGWHRYMIVMAAQAGYKIDEVKVKLYPRKSGKSKFGLTQLPLGFLDLLSVKFELSFTKKPLLFFGTAGLITGFLGFVTSLVALYMRYIKHDGFRPLLYAVILLLVSGLLLFAIGFLAELIVSIKDDISRQKGGIKP